MDTEKPETVEETLKRTMEELDTSEEVVEAKEEEQPQKEVVEEGVSEQQEESLSEGKEADTTEEEPQASEELKIPDNWDADRKAAFDSLETSEAKENYIKVVKDFERGFNKKFEDLAEVRKRDEAITSLFSPYDQAFKQAGMTHVDGIRNLLNAQKALETNPAQGLTRLIQEYAQGNTQEVLAHINKQFGYTQSAEEEGQDWEDPKILELQNKLNSLEQTQAQSQAAIHEQKIADAQRQVDIFKNATGEDGELLHPHYEEVQQDMILYVQNGDDIETAYTKAVRANDDIFQSLLEIERKKGANAISQQKKKEVEKAKSTNVKTLNTPPENKPAVPGKVSDHVAQEASRLGLI